jgi:hypothetical protein
MLGEGVSEHMGVSSVEFRTERGEKEKGGIHLLLEIGSESFRVE